MPDGSLCPPPAAGSGGQVLVAEPGWRRAVQQPDRLVLRVLRGLGSDALVVLADDRTVRRLNARFRNRDKPTNVLSFAAADGEGGGLSGELVLALGVVRREARDGGRSVARHMAHLVAHGVLHLAGYDHHHAGDARAMEMAEGRALARLGLPNPWRAR